MKTEKEKKKNIYFDFEKVLHQLEKEEKSTVKFTNFLKSHFKKLILNLKNFIKTNDDFLQNFEKEKKKFDHNKEDHEFLTVIGELNNRVKNINTIFSQNVKFYKLVIEDKIEKIIKNNSKMQKSLKLDLEKNLDKIKLLREKNSVKKKRYFEKYKSYWGDRNKFMSGSLSILKENYKNKKKEKNKIEDLYKLNYKDLSKNWEYTSNNFDELKLKYNIETLKFREEILMLYDLLTAKINENLFLEEKQKIDLKLQFFDFLNYNWERNKFKDFFYDFVMHQIKKNNNNSDLYLFKKNGILKENINSDDQRTVYEFNLMMLKNNNLCTTATKIKKLGKKLDKFSLRKNSLKYFLNFFISFLFLKEEQVSFNEFVVEIFENLIFQNIGTFFDSEKYDYESLFNITFICYEIFSCNIILKEDYFSNKFLKLLRSLNFWSHFEVWEKFFDYFEKIFSKLDISLYFTNILKEKKKSRIKNIFNIYEIITFIGFYFLKIPFCRIFDILNKLNKKKNSLPPNSIFDLSKMLEMKIKKNYSSQIEKKNLTNINSKIKKNLTILKNILVFFPENSQTIKKLLFLNKYYYKNIKKNILKFYLLNDKLERIQRIKIWTEICLLKLSENPLEENLQQKSQIFSLDEKIVHILKMDVRRTNFVKNKKKELIELLIIVSSNYPKNSYYQGMNCIGGFFLNYLDDFDKSKLIFEYLIKYRLEKYFLDSFAKLKKLLFVSEKIIHIFLPKLYAHFENLKIGIEFFISPILLTIFCSGLQFIENYNLVAKIIDIFIIEGWVGFFKIFIFIFKHIEKKLLEMEYDTILEFLNKKLYEKLFYFNLTHLKEKCFKIKIKKSLIFRLEMEYDSTRKVVDEYWNSYYEKKRENARKNLAKI